MNTSQRNDENRIVFGSSQHFLSKDDFSDAGSPSFAETVIAQSMESQQLNQAKAEEQERSILKNIENSIPCSPRTTLDESKKASLVLQEKESSVKAENPKAKRKS